MKSWTGCKIKRLPQVMRVEIDCKLREGWSLLAIAQWLVAQTVPEDIPLLEMKAGDPYSLLWTRDARTQRPPALACQRALCKWFRGGGYSGWLREHRLKAAPQYEFAGDWSGKRGPAWEAADRRPDRRKRWERVGGGGRGGRRQETVDSRQETGPAVIT